MNKGRLFLMRHGEPVLAGRMLGRTDSAPTPDGIARCAAQAARLPAAALLSSDLARARLCAAAIGEAALDPRWRELDFGAWDGRAASELDTAALGRFWNDPDAFPPPAGERWSALVARVREALADLPDGPVLVVTHGGPMRAALHLLCDLDRTAIWAIDFPYAALLVFDRWDDSARVAGLWPCDG